MKADDIRLTDKEHGDLAKKAKGFKNCKKCLEATSDAQLRKVVEFIEKNSTIEIRDITVATDDGFHIRQKREITGDIILSAEAWAELKKAGDK